GFITLGKEGCAVITQHGIERLPPAVNMEGKKTYNLGAGDTAFAGFIAGHTRGLDPMQSAEIAMALAGEKIKINNGSRLPDPLGTLRNMRPELAAKLETARMPASSHTGKGSGAFVSF